MYVARQSDWEIVSVFTIMISAWKKNVRGLPIFIPWKWGVRALGLRDQGVPCPTVEDFVFMNTGFRKYCEWEKRKGINVDWVEVNLPGGGGWVPWDH